MPAACSAPLQQLLDRDAPGRGRRHAGAARLPSCLGDLGRGPRFPHVRGLRTSCSERVESSESGLEQRNVRTTKIPQAPPSLGAAGEHESRLLSSSRGIHRLQELPLQFPLQWKARDGRSTSAAVDAGVQVGGRGGREGASLGRSQTECSIQQPFLRAAGETLALPWSRRPCPVACPGPCMRKILKVRCSSNSAAAPRPASGPCSLGSPRACRASAGRVQRAAPASPSPSRRLGR